MIVLRSGKTVEVSETVEVIYERINGASAEADGLYKATDRFGRQVVVSAWATDAVIAG